MRSIIKSFIPVLLMSFSIGIKAQPVCDAYFTESKIKIDGKLNDKAWENAEFISDFYDIRGKEYPAPLQKTYVKFLYDKDNLYIGAIIKENNIRAKLNKRDDIIWKDNDFEVFLDPFFDGKLYYELEVNALGTVMDLLMEKPYKDKGSFLLNWDIQGLKLKVNRTGSLNDDSDRDDNWCVEMAIPFDALKRNFQDPRDNKIWRLNLSRVQWNRPDKEENWVLSPTGIVDIHHPDKWAYLRFVSKEGKPHIYKKTVKNWMWERLKPDWSEQEYKRHFALVKSCGISAILFEGYDENIYRMCKEAGLEAHYWKWTLNRKELLEIHPDWFAESRSGKSTAKEPPYVDYYRFLCPLRSEVREYLAKDYLRLSELKYIDGMHLDYVRFPDVILPVSLWKNYGIEQTSELPDYDFCYCSLCRETFKKQTGRDPLLEKYPMEDQSWINFRLDAITNVVEAIHDTLKVKGKFLSAAVFPGPTMAKKMVRQDWGNWDLEAVFPMIYNGFYYEGPEWIGRSVKEGVKALEGRLPLYAGLMFPDIKGEDFEKALDAAFSNGASGVSFFDGPDDEYLYRLKKYLDEHNYKY
ncbi:MAG: carbohydrate-binding family 9-like protein [Candidatus Cryptobacteroides sp.]